MQVKNKILLDTSALLALLKKEPGYEKIESIIANCAISSVNLSEFVAVLSRSGVTENDIDGIINDLVPEIIPFSENLGVKTGKLLSSTKKHGLSLGDRACLATGDHYQMDIYTADKVWLELKNITSTKIIVIR